MQYLILLFLTVLVILIMVWFGIKAINLKYLFLQRIVEKKIIDAPCFSTLITQELCRYILKQPKLRRRQMIKFIIESQFKSLAKLIDDPILNAKFNFMLTGNIALKKNSDVLYLMMQAWNYLRNNQHDKASSILTAADLLKKQSRALTSLRHYLMSQIALFEGDLLGASEEASLALKGFQKENMLFEEAQTYFVLGNIYRVSGVFDTADFMLRSALKLFRFLKSANGEAEILGTLGLLNCVQKRFDEASDYFSSAKNVSQTSPNNKIFNFITCQEALLELLKGNLKQAQKIANQALKKSQTPAEEAFASDILSRTAYAEKDWKKTVKFAQKAAEIYRNEHNYSSYFENLYLTAEGLAGLDKFDEAEILLRDIIYKEQYHKSCFYVANAYTLLGLILLQKGDMSRAKAIFNQALKQELRNERHNAAAIDYANLAVVEKKCGNRDEARKNLEAALAYAKDTDEELYNQIRSALD